MRDFRGVDLSIGDKVAYAANSSGKQRCVTRLVEASIVDFTLMKIRLHYPKGDYRTVLKFPEQVVKL